MASIFVMSTPYHVDSDKAVKEKPKIPSQQEDVKVPNFRENEFPVPLPVDGHRQQQQPKNDEVEKMHNKLEKKEIMSWERLLKRQFQKESNAQERKNQENRVT